MYSNSEFSVGLWNKKKYTCYEKKKNNIVQEVINVCNYITTSLLCNFLMKHARDLKFEMQNHIELVIFT